MSKKQAIAFFEEISKNQQLAQEVEKVVKGKNSDEEKAKELISLAKNHNFIFTQEDAQNAQEELKKPLSHEEMLEVSGGKMNLKSSLMAAAMLLGLGAGVATLHNMESSAMKRRGGREHFGFSDSSGKSGKDENRQSRKKGGTQQTTHQTQHATTEAANSRQNETPPSNDQESAQSAERHATRSRKEKKAWAYVEHKKEAAERYSDVYGCGYHQVEWARRVSASGALPAADWPAAPPANLETKKNICRFCGKKLEPHGEKKLDVKCANAGCIYNWVFPPTGDKGLNGKQRGQKNCGHYVRWALLPALILDSRHECINSTGSSGRGTARQFAIETPAEAWAVWHLLDGHNDSWKPVEDMMTAHGVDETKRDEVIRLLEESYDNLVQGNERLRAIGLGSEVQQLVEGHNNDWQNFIGAMVERGYGSEEVKQAVTKMINSYYMLKENQPRDSGYTPSPAARAEIKAAHQWFEIAMRQAKARRQAREARRQQAREARWQEEARLPATLAQTIEKLQRGEELSLE